MSQLTPIGARLVIAIIRGYQLALRPLLAGSGACRFLPTCSEYATESVLKHGVFRGGWLALKRVTRCHPLGGSGLDPVPSADPLLSDSPLTK